MNRKKPARDLKGHKSRPVLSRAECSASVHPFAGKHIFPADMATPPSLPSLPTEIIQKIFLECNDISSVVNLSATSRHFWEVYNSSKKLDLIESVLEIQFSPLYDAIQVAVYDPNQNDEVYLAPEPPMSMALAKQITRIGFVAQKWEQMYPMLRWRENAEYRRVLNVHESYRFRRALYRLWLYGKAFHSDDFLQAASRNLRMATDDDDERLIYISQFDDDELMEISELNDAFQSILINDLCPSNAIIQQRYDEGFPGQAPLYFGSYHTHPVHCYDQECFCRTLELRRDLPRSWAAEAWGPRKPQMKMVGRLLKLEPDQLLHFKENLHNRAERLNYLVNFSLTFHRYRSSLGGAMLNVRSERDYDLAPSYNDVDGGIIDYIDEEPGERNETTKFSITNLGWPGGLAGEEARRRGSLYE